MVEAAVNGTPITFLVDTGASAIYLTPGDAARLGWTPPRLTYSERYATASGVVHAAPVTLRSLRIGPLELYDLPASVGQESSSVSLLGMPFLRSEERRVGKECVGTCRSRWGPYNYKKNK